MKKFLLDRRKIRDFKILNGFYNINRDLLFDLDDGMVDIEAMKKTTQKKISLGYQKVCFQ